MIKISNLTKEYDRVILKNINLTMSCNKLYLIKGISGSGKTTLLNIIAGLDLKYNGTVTVNKQNIQKMKKKAFEAYRLDIGYINQRSLLIGVLSVLDNLLFIKNDLELIYYYADLLNVRHLLERKPKELSGGERQRIAIIRALLLGQRIIIADEPTASLDKENTKIIVDAFMKLKSEDRILIISTHNDFFDEIADEVLVLNYGELSHLGDTDEDVSRNFGFEPKKRPFNLRNNLKYILTRFKSSNNWVNILIQSLLFILIFGLIAFTVNFKREYLKKETDKKPIQVFNVTKDEFGKYERIYGDVQSYDNYIIEEESFVVYSLLNEQYCIFSLPQMIEYGEFPNARDEVLINNMLATKLFADQQLSDIVGQEIIIKDNQYQIAGIITSDERLILEAYGAGIKYNYLNEAKAFMLYDEIKNEGSEYLDFRNETTMIFDDFYIYPEVLDYIYEGYLETYYVNLINDKIASVNLYTKWIYMGFVALGIIIMIFIGNQITLSLHYRRKEIGYLQMFGVSKSRLKFNIIGQYFINTFISIIISTIVYRLLATIILKVLDINMLLPFTGLLLICGLIIIYTLILIYIPLNRFFKRDILDLITK